MGETVSVRTARAGGLEMEYITFGAGPRDLVILPGLSVKSVLGSAEAIAAAYRVFTDDYTVWLLDRRRDLPEGYTVRSMAEDTAAVLRALGIGAADVFGVSLGGMIAQFLAIDAPDLVRRLVLGSTMARSNGSVERRTAAWIRMAEAGDARGVAQAFGGMLFSPRAQALYGDEIIAMHSGATAEELDRFARLARAGAGFNAYDELDKLRCPTLVIGAWNDRVATAAASVELAEKLGCELCMYGDGYGHGVYDEAPDYKDRILRFFRG